MTRLAGESVSLATPILHNIPVADEALMHRLVAEAIPQFSNRPLINKFMCWIADTADSDFIVDFVPGCEGLAVLSGDSGHAFKFLPTAGQWATKLLEDGVQIIKRWKWKVVDVKADCNNDISWRVGHTNDIKEVSAELGI